MPSKFGLSQTDKEDLIQQTLLKACVKFDRFKEGTNFNGWVYTIMRNLFIDKCRVDNRSRIYEITDWNIDVHKVENDYSELAIKRYINKLPQKIKLPLMLRIEGYSYEEIATTLKMPRNTVGAYIHEARENLKRQINGKH